MDTSHTKIPRIVKRNASVAKKERTGDIDYCYQGNRIFRNFIENRLHSHVFRIRASSRRSFHRLRIPNDIRGASLLPCSLK